MVSSPYINRLFDMAEERHGPNIRPIDVTVEVMRENDCGPGTDTLGLYDVLWYNDVDRSTHIVRVAH